MPRIRELAYHPRSWVTPAAAEATLQLTSEHQRLLACLEQLPQCLCHHDAFRRNLMIRRTAAGAEQTVAIDWAAVGPGAVGEEIASMVGLSLYFLEIDAAEIPHLDETVFVGYLEGLRDAGWHGDEGLVRLGYTAAAGLFIASTMTGFILPRIEDETEMTSWDAMYGRERWIEAYRQTHRYGLQLGQEALSLLNSF